MPVSYSERTKPNHGARVLLPSEPQRTLCTGKVVWSRLDPPADGQPLMYRAGVLFAKLDQDAVEHFIAEQSRRKSAE